METLMQQRGTYRVADSGARVVRAAAPSSRTFANAARSVHLKRNGNMSRGSVRFIGIGNRKEGGRAQQRAVRYLQATSEGISPENAESDAREQLLEQAKAESASSIDEEQEPFRDAVESGQTIGEATTDLQFGENDGKSADEVVIHGSKEHLEKSKPNDKSQPIEKGVSSEVWGARDGGGNTHAFLDDSQKVQFHGEDDNSVFGIGGQRAGDSRL